MSWSDGGGGAWSCERSSLASPLPSNVTRTSSLELAARPATVPTSYSVKGRLRVRARVRVRVRVYVRVKVRVRVRVRVRARARARVVRIGLELGRASPTSYGSTSPLRIRLATRSPTWLG